MGSKYKVTFPSERQYIVNQSGNVKEKNSNVLEIEELNENGSTYFGWDVINYAETLPSNLQDTKWQLFYAGALDGETEERIYLISKEYVKNSVLPAVIKNGAEIETAKPISGNNEYKACFGNNTSDGIMPHYVGSADISTEIKKYNKDYFKDYTSASPNMKAVAYMLDTTTWSAFATSTKSYAEYAMGGPSIELFLIAYNKYSGTNYKSDAVSNKGYQVSETPSSTFNNSMTMGIIPDVTTGEKLEDNPFSVSSIRDVADGYWLASPSNANSNIIMFITNRGDIFTFLNWYNREYSYAGFRISSYSSIRFKLFIRKGKRFKWK